MGLFVNVEFLSPGGARTVDAALRAFLAQSHEWRLLERESEEYSQAIDGHGLVAVSASDGPDAGIAVAIASMDDDAKGMYLCNIVPKNGSLTGDECNRITLDFVKAFRLFARRSARTIKVRVVLSKRATTLEQIIPGQRTRRLFEGFLAAGNIWGTAPIRHPNDVHRLDTFICALYRWRTQCDVSALGTWLVAIKNWSDADARWLCERIETGLAVLRVNSRF